MKIVASSICKQGGREYNQDFVACSLNGNSACLVVCDGLGSYIGSEVASNLCATKVVETYEQILTLDSTKAHKLEYVQTYLQTAHNFVVAHKEKNPKIGSSCTTVSCVVTDCENTIISHIGDTRIHYFKKDKLIYISKDHSLAQVAVDMGQITHDEIRNHKDQNKLTRVLGSDYYIPPTNEVINTPLEVGDAFVLCTDGFWEYILENEMADDILSSSSPSEAIKKMENKLLMRVGKNNDNYSAIVAMVVKS